MPPSAPRTIAIDPVTRIEGHLRVETTIDGGRVVAARVLGRMYRGFERLLVGRHPVDAVRLTQRTCGICHEVHGMAASLALEDLYGITPPPNGLLLREAILALHLVTDHLIFFYQLCLPDYLDFGRLRDYRGDDPRLVAMRQLATRGGGVLAAPPPADALRDLDTVCSLARAYHEVFAVRREAAAGMALLCGKVPFAHTLLPGGITAEVTIDKVLRLGRAIEQTAHFVQRSYLPQTLELGRRFPDYLRLGGGNRNFLSYPAFAGQGAPLFPGGTSIGGRRGKVDLQRIKEDLDHSFFGSDGHPDPHRAGAYSWIKGLRYGNERMEVGPLARLLLGESRELRRTLATLGVREVTSSVMTRLVARAVEAQMLCTHALTLLEGFRPGGTAIVPCPLDKAISGRGVGMTAAARGALCHMVEAERGQIVRYRMIVPSTWNFGPAVGESPGVVEAALLGTPVSAASGAGAVEAGRVVRSFDPCIACAVH